MPPHSQSLLMGGIRFEGFLQHLGLVPHALLLRRYLRLGRNSGGIFASPTNHLLPRFSPAGRTGSGLPQDPRGSLEVILPGSFSEGSLHSIGSSETEEFKGRTLWITQ